MSAVHPGVRVVDGPVLAELGPGDVIGVPHDHFVLLGRPAVAVPEIRAVPFSTPTLRAFRFNDRQWQVREEGADADAWVPAARRHAVGPWTVELVDDAGVLSCVKTPMEGVHVVRPTRVARQGEWAASWWVAVKDSGELYDVIATDHAFASFDHVAGVTLWDLERESQRRLDPSLARAIVDQLDDEHTSPVVCFDGRVRRLPSLLRFGTRYDDLDDLCDKLCNRKREKTPAAAPLDEVAGLVRALRPGLWAVEQGLWEEAPLTRIRQKKP